MNTTKPTQIQFILTTFFIVFAAHLSFGQAKVEVELVTQLPKAKPIKRNGKIEQISYYDVLGSTTQHLVVLETVTLCVKSSHKRWFNEEQYLHYFDLNSLDQPKLSQLVWQQSQHKIPGRHYKTPDGESLDGGSSPKYRIVGDYVVSMHRNYSKKFSEKAGYSGNPLRSFKVIGNRVIRKEVNVQAKTSYTLNTDFSFTQDSTHIVVENSGLLNGKEKQGHTSCVNYYNFNLELEHHIPLKYSGIQNFYYSNRIIQFGYPEIKGKSPKKLNALVIDLDLEESYEGEVMNLGSPKEGLRVPYISLFNDNKNDKTFCIHYKGNQKNYTAKISRWSFSDNVTFDVENTRVSPIRVSESGSGEQTKMQDNYFKFLSDINLRHYDVSIANNEEIQISPNFRTSSWKLEGFLDGGYYLVGYPMLLYMNLEEPTPIILDRVMYSDGFAIQFPYVLHSNQYEVFLIGNFPEPTLDGKNVKYYNHANQVLQLMEVDLVNHEVSRHNIYGEFGEESEPYNLKTSLGQIAHIGDRIYMASNKEKGGQGFLMYYTVTLED